VRRSRHALHAAGLLATALAVSSLLAAPAMAAHRSPRLSRHDRAVARARLLHAVKRHPGIVRSRSFLRKAALVDFVLPVTVRLRQGANPATDNPNVATVDFGASLGQRSVSLGGSLPAEIHFRDSFDGGALGNVDLTLDAGGALTTNSIPILWNTQVASDPGTHWYEPPGATPGCGDFTNAGTVPSTGTASPTVGKTLDTPLAPAFHGVPFFATQADADLFAETGSTALIAGTVEEFPGADDVSLLSSRLNTGDPFALGGGEPFPSVGPDSVPGGFTQPPSPGDAVLRTAPLTLTVTPPGTVVGADNADGEGAQSTMTVVTGRNGGTANLFGNIAGKTHGVDVTLTVGTKINSIVREVDPDPAALVAGQPYPSAAFRCRQFWTGFVQNYLNDITLVGNLRISPAITPDGHLRIAKVSLVADQDWDVSLAACLLPYSTFSAGSGYPGGSPTVPADALAGQSASGASALNPTPLGVKCNEPPTPLIANSSVPPLVPLTPGLTGTHDGSQVSVSASIFVEDVEADVLIGAAG
jgi:hypothetical protein